MFTGLVEQVGRVVEVAPVAGGQRLTVQTSFSAADLAHGASVAVDGVCLTVVASDAPGRFTADVSAESLQRTTLGERRAGDGVNLERPLAFGARLGGHLMLGHVDGTGEILTRTPQGEGVRFTLRLPRALWPLVVEKGSIALDGISLTVNDLPALDEISLFLIPESLRATTWGGKGPGARVNVEADILGKHVARLMQFKEMQHD